MRPTGKLHLGNYHGALRNWVELQERLEGYFFIADWHALTTDYENPGQLQQRVHEMVVDWLAAGLDPERAAIFVQSEVPAHAELHLLLSMITPLSWLERVPTYKDQQEQLKEKDLATYGFLGYPLLQSADILIYRPAFIPVGEDQVAHVEITREIARRFNNIYGRDEAFGKKVRVALGRLPPEAREQYASLKRRFQEGGDAIALAEARTLVSRAANLPDEQRELLLASLEGDHHRLLPAPEALLTHAPKVPGLDGRKDVQVLRQHHRDDRGAGLDREEDQGYDHRPGARAAHRSGQSRKVPGVGPAQAVFLRGDACLGVAGLHHGGHRLPRLQEAGDREGLCRVRGDARARRAVPEQPGTRARDPRGWRAARQCHRGRDHAGGAPGNAPAAGSSGMNLTPTQQGQQVEMPFAMVLGEPLTELPRDLYIPPQAMEVFLDAFEGPLDLLLYLIRRQNLNILDIPIAEITRQYMEYIDLMSELQLDLAGEYLVMAATLAEIKSRMLLPRAALPGEGTEDDPRAELIRRLQEYERFKQAAQDLDVLPRLERDHYLASAEFSARRVVKLLPDVTLKELLLAFKDVALRAEMFAHHHIQREPLSVRARMSDVLANLQQQPGTFMDFPQLFLAQEGRMGVAVTFIAILELKREGLIEIVQNEAFAPIHVCSADPARFARVIEGSAEEVVEEDSRLLAESIAVHGTDEAHEASGDAHEASTGANEEAAADAPAQDGTERQ
jgi:tryptophanyl-tRNA synthetase/chromatin segregation and condensation protein Rec8/ScpA/Scc1 (kleisin family)